MFRLQSPYQPTGDQPEAIEQLVAGLARGEKFQTLLGATGTGKTFTMANVIARTGKPTLLISHNKTLAAQLYEEMKELFPDNAVCYFVSYYDYYQPEAYIPQRDIYIEKDASRNQDLDRLRLLATSSLLSRPDVIVISSVSCLYGLGSPDEFRNRMVVVERGTTLKRRDFLISLANMQYVRKEIEPGRGNFRVRGDSIEVFPASEQHAIRIGLFGEEVETIETFDPVSGEVLSEESRAWVFPAVHYMMPEDRMKRALDEIKAELDERVLELRAEGKLLEAQRLIGRTKYDLEMIQETGYCGGIENYSRFFDGRARGQRAWTLMDYFRRVPGHTENDWLVVVDESHVTLPQIRGMYFGDKARKQTLVDHGFRLPSAMDNRPLRFEEFEEIIPAVVYVSATPSPLELERSHGVIAEQVIRPTGLVDPIITLLPARGQIPDLLERCKERAARGDRVLVTALTKRLCEELTNYLHKNGVRVRYLHSEIETLDRIEILKELREGLFDVLVGVNLLREGLDLPEVSLVCILDADTQGFLRSRSSLIQTMGRAARNSGGEAILYADKMTPEMEAAIDEVSRRRAKQIAYNKEHGITPETIVKAIRQGIALEIKANRTAREAVGTKESRRFDKAEALRELEEDMLAAAGALEFEKAARLRDQRKRVEALPEVEGMAEEPEVEEKPRPKAGMPGTRAGRGRKGKK